MSERQVTDRSTMDKKCPQIADNFGCEFIDDGSYGRVSQIVTLAPWKLKYPDAIELSVGFLKKIADKSYLNHIQSKDKDLIQVLRSDISKRGLVEPLVIVYDKTLKIRLQDGNHRLLAIDSLPGWSAIPVVTKQVISVRGAGMALAQEQPLSVLLCLLDPRTSAPPSNGR